MYEGLSWKTGLKLEKYHEGSKFPFEVITREGNMALNAGMNMIWALVVGATNTIYGTTQAKMAVGNATTAANATQTALQATAGGQATVAMVANYPTSKGETAKMYWKGEFATNIANFAWEEWAITNGVLLNRKVESLGTKSGGTWSLESYLQLQNA